MTIISIFVDAHVFRVYVKAIREGINWLAAAVAIVRSSSKNDHRPRTPKAYITHFHSCAEIRWEITTS